MSTVNPLPTSIAPGHSRDAAAQGGAQQQQRWLQDLERTWLHSWQQAGSAPATGAAHSASAGPSSRPVGNEPASPSATKPVIAPEAPIPEAIGERAASQRPVDASFAARAVAPSRSPAATAADPVGVTPSNPLPQPVLPARARPAQVPAAQPTARQAAPAAPAAPGPQAASLHLREAGADSVMAALRDSGLGAAASQATAAALARQLAQAGYAQVQVYVNGTALRRQANEPQAHHQEKPHGH
jgi:hypothetical protein